MAAIDVPARLSPQMRAVLARQAGDDFATDVGLDEVRRRYIEERAFWNEGGPGMAEISDEVVQGPHGGVGTRRYRPAMDANGEQPPPCIVFLHGGGWVVGSLETHDRVMRSLAAKTGAVVVGVDYSLSPEAKFPRAVEESAAVASHLHRHAGALGINGERISFAGDSGGANLSVASALLLRDTVTDWPGTQCLLLYYGLYGLRDSASRRLYGGSWDGLARADLDYYMSAYTSCPSDLESPYLDCLSADLTGVAKACYVGACDLDPLRDDSTALAAILEESGVRRELAVFKGVLHGFLHYARMLPEATDALDGGARFYRAAMRGAL